MNRRTLCVLFALTFTSTIAACGSSDDSDDKPANAALGGTYRPVDQGAIGSITFSASKDDYLLMPTGCAKQSCAEIGTFRLDNENHQIILQNAATKETRTIALQVLKTTDTNASSLSLVQSVAPLDLVDPGDQLARTGQPTTTGGGQKVTGDQQQLATGGNQLAGLASQLIQLIQQAMMNGQQMQQDQQNQQMMQQQQPQQQPAQMQQQPAQMQPAANPADPNAPKTCKDGIPTKDSTIAEVAAYFIRCPAGP